MRAPVWLVALSLAAHHCSPAPEKARNVLIVCIDTLRSDHVGAYGYERETTPALDRLAERGVVIEAATAHSSWTVPSVASLMTSLYPFEHGAYAEGELKHLGRGSVLRQLRSDVETLAELFRAGGFRTGLLSANPYLFGAFQRGFDTARVGRRPAEDLVTEALSWLDESSESPFFLYLQLMDLHQPIQPPEEYFHLFPVSEGGPRGPEHVDWSYGEVAGAPTDEFRRYRAHKIALYDGALRYVDDQLGRLLEGLERSGKLGETLVVVTSDHGEEFWDHAQEQSGWDSVPRNIWGIGHGHTFYEELLRVPLIFSGAGVAEGSRASCRRGLVDVAPTVLEAVDLTPAPQMRGKSLGNVLAGGIGAGACGDADVLVEQPAYGPDATAVISEGFKLVLAGGRFPVLFDLKKDPAERENLAAQLPLEVGRMERVLRTFGNESVVGPAPGGTPLVLGEETRRQLESLGYLK